MDLSVGRILIARDLISARVAEVGRQLSADLERLMGEADDSARIVMVPILTGAIVFAADLIRHLPQKMSIRPVTISSYPGAATTSQGVNIRGELPTDLRGSHVIIVDDILDSGRTLGLLRRMIAAQDPASLRIAVLLRKHKVAGRDEEVRADYACFDIGDEFVVGYGLDYDGYFRNLPEVRAMVEVTSEQRGA
ncbi:MAG: hypoxanthine phosphoribosyltransferase [Phycisphaerales bacterium]|nr:hypoxanthine phosphoribosyltransferase [Phycisphaerales bacterium]